jgi:hypothetical protein
MRKTRSTRSGEDDRSTRTRTAAAVPRQNAASFMASRVCALIFLSGFAVVRAAAISSLHCKQPARSPVVAVPGSFSQSETVRDRDRADRHARARCNVPDCPVFA